VVNESGGYAYYAWSRESGEMMVRWVCGVTLKDKVKSEELISRLGVESMYDVLRCDRLRWVGHVERKPVDDWVKRCQIWRCGQNWHRLK